MPTRLVDGDALWRSEKLKSVPEDIRAEYANLIPLAEANGSFECTPDRVWVEVYAFNRTDVTVNDVTRILDEFERVGMLKRWNAGGKTYGFFNGIENRLPPKSAVKRGDYRISAPKPPKWVTTEPHVEPMNGGEGLGFGLGLGKEEVRATVKPKNLLKWMPLECRLVLGLKPEPVEWRKAEIQELSEVYGSERVAEIFTQWLESQKGKEIQKPLLEFLKVADALLRGILTTNNPGLDELNAKLHEIGGNPFSGKYRTDLSQMRKIYSDLEIEYAYRELINNRDEFQMKFAVRDFCEGGGVAIILARRKELEESEKSRIESAAARIRATEQVERELAEMESKTEPEDEFFKIGV